MRKWDTMHVVHVVYLSQSISKIINIRLVGEIEIDLIFIVNYKAVEENEANKSQNFS